MRIRIEHETRYAYDRPVRSMLQMYRMTPRDHDGQHVIRWRIEPSVEGRLKADQDALGNVVHVFSPDDPLSDLSIRVSGELETSDTAGLVQHAIELAPTAYYLRGTSLTEPDDALRTFARDVASGGGDTLALLHRVLLAVNEEVRFDTTPTNSTTTAAEAFAGRVGVCQDLAHIFLATARHLDIPSRYVSGYFHRADGVVEQEAGHAWVEALVPGLGWVGFDPANGICITEAHIRIAVGLDYLAAAPVRGSRVGGGSEALSVRLRVDQGGRQSQG